MSSIRKSSRRKPHPSRGTSAGLRAVKVYDYHDYRAFLADWFDEQRRARKGFSLRAFAAKAGIACHSYCSAVVRGRRNLSKTACERMVEGLGLEKGQARYFRALVHYNQTTKLRDKLAYKRKMEQEIRAADRDISPPYRLVEDHFQFFSRWYHSVVYNLIGMEPFTGDYVDLAQTVEPSISVKQARGSVQLLERLGLIQKGANGTYRVSHAALRTDDQIKSLALSQYYIAGTGLARRAVEETPGDQRNVSGVVVGVSHECYARMVERINAFREELVQMAVDDTAPADRVYQLALYLFPVSRERGK